MVKLIKNNKYVKVKLKTKKTKNDGLTKSASKWLESVDVHSSPEVQIHIESNVSQSINFRILRPFLILKLVQLSPIIAGYKIRGIISYFKRFDLYFLRKKYLKKNSLALKYVND